MEYEKWDEVLAPYNNAVEELKVKFKIINRKYIKISIFIYSIINSISVYF